MTIKAFQQQSAVEHEDYLADCPVSIQYIERAAYGIFHGERIDEQSKMSVVYALQVARGVRMS